MPTFHFPLRRTLEWRRTQLELEENQLHRLTADREQLVLAAVKLELLKGRAERGVREAGILDPADLWALAAYRQKLGTDLRAIEERKRELENRMAGQRQRVLEAQRRCRLLEKLEERRRAEWRIAVDRETEVLATESFLAGWRRG